MDHEVDVLSQQSISEVSAAIVVDPQKCVRGLTTDLTLKAHRDLTGQKFGRLTVIQFAYRSRHGGGLKWLCQCDCGEQIFAVVNGWSLKTGNTKSCGCLSNEVRAARRSLSLKVRGAA